MGIEAVVAVAAMFIGGVAVLGASWVGRDRRAETLDSRGASPSRSAGRPARMTHSASPIASLLRHRGRVASYYSTRCVLLLVLVLAISSINPPADTQEPPPLKLLWLSVSPPAIDAAYIGPIDFTFAVAGDVSELFANAGTERWARATTSQVDGHSISIFRETLHKDSYYVTVDPWQFEALWDIDLYTTPDHFAGVFLRVPGIPLNMPVSAVRRINDRVQYSSHVVNFVIPDFGDNLITTDGYDLRKVSRRFYEHFADGYESIAVIPANGNWHQNDTWGAYSEIVRNPIAGIGQDIVDYSHLYGSNGSLRSLQLYRHVSLFHWALVHEVGHTWLDYFDWTGLTGIGGVTDGVHGVGLTFPSAGSPRVQRDASGFFFEEAPYREWNPWLRRPMAGYALGWKRAADIPEILVFEDQSQPRVVGERVTGDYRRVHINDVMARHGRRRGPAEDGSWRMATVVVTRDELLSSELMSAYNFVAARNEAVVGGGSNGTTLFEATGGRMRLDARVMPKGGPRIRPPIPVNDMPFMSIAPDEHRAIKLDAPLETTYRAGEKVVVSGEVGGASYADDEICATWIRLRSDQNRVRERGVCQQLQGLRFRYEWEGFRRKDVGGLYSLVFEFGGQSFAEFHGLLVVDADVGTTLDPGENRLAGGQRLQTRNYIRAKGAPCRLEFGADGNLVAYADGMSYWDSGTGPVAAGGDAVMRRDGNFVIYDAAGVERWSTRTGGNPGARVTVQRDCNVVVRAPGGAPLWASGRP